MTLPPVTVKASSRRVAELVPTASLNRIRNVNAAEPSCSAGTSSKLAVSGVDCSSTGAYGTMRAKPAASGPPVPVQIAPASVKARPPCSRIDTLPVPDGVTVNLHRSSRPSTGAASVTAPPVTASAWSRRSAALAVMPALNAIRKLNGLSPSCEAGTSSKLAVSGASMSWGLSCRSFPDP